MSAPALPPRVLLADDDEATVAVLAHRLQRDGYRFVTCADGETALAHAATGAFDLVAAGAGLPGLDGLGLLRVLRADPALCAVPFVLLAWPGNDGLLARAFALGASDVLMRPFSLVEATARLGRLLGRVPSPR